MKKINLLTKMLSLLFFLGTGYYLSALNEINISNAAALEANVNIGGDETPTVDDTDAVAKIGVPTTLLSKKP